MTQQQQQQQQPSHFVHAAHFSAVPLSCWRAVCVTAFCGGSPPSIRSVLHPYISIHVLTVRFVIMQVIPSLQGDASTQSPPDLPSFIFKERIVYLVSDDHLLANVSDFPPSTNPFVVVVVVTFCS